jgi:hypothetical protein
VHDAVNSHHGFFQRGHVADIRRCEFLVRRGAAERGDIGEANNRIAAAQALA